MQVMRKDFSRATLDLSFGRPYCFHKPSYKRSSTKRRRCAWGTPR